MSLRYSSKSMLLILLQVTEAELANFFSDCGRVVDCRICGDPNLAMRFAFIEFQAYEGVQKVRQAQAALSTPQPFHPCL